MAKIHIAVDLRLPLRIQDRGEGQEGVWGEIVQLLVWLAYQSLS